MSSKPPSRSFRERNRSRHFVTREVPLYYQLASLLREKIISGQYAPNDQIPTETDLVKDYGLSRITVRQALASLEEEDLIVRARGRGTFVTDRPPFTGNLRIDGSINDLISMGLGTSVKLLGLRTVTASAEDAAALELEPGSEITRITRVRYYHQKPYCYLVNYLPLEIGSKVSKAYLKQGSMLKFIEGLGIPLCDAMQSVRASLADARLARRLQVRIGAPLLYVDCLVRTDGGRPVERVHIHYRSDIYSFTVHLTRDPAETETTGAGWAFKERKSAAS